MPEMHGPLYIRYTIDSVSMILDDCLSKREDKQNVCICSRCKSAFRFYEYILD